MTKIEKAKLSPDYLLRGTLTKIGDTFDRLTGRRWLPSSSLAASELISRMKTLLDAEAKIVSGKGTVVPHNIQIKMQWDKFSTDSESSIEILENELLTAAVDHINDSLYYTFAPIRLSVRPDYFTDGVKMLVGFENFGEDEREVEVNVTVPSIDLNKTNTEAIALPSKTRYLVTAQFQIKAGIRKSTAELDGGERMTVGRSVGNDLAIDDISVSKIHAAISLDDSGTLTVADTGSTNGTFINGERISYGKAIAFDPSRSVRFGTVEVKFDIAQIELPEAELEEVQMGAADTVEIGGFEFSSRQTDVSGPTPADKPVIEHTSAEDSTKDGQ
ncbi:MAG TPA: FHA domain-containing protein [Pyrinomonadaceae bacterium]|nr:FHA domain-containing protein [Chloracidobacterium sp.]MBP9936448.1 FHA domain-containing protein [Pyrinomonadaceae bacterium]MBK7804005.1 FHA domain-containing protein [Chloracidobacterium sp.]MBK9439325.1 FHA domain-containing protein [Chloracidobacterium sp.]MBK9768655.1 FHA domain-containing protein [Chloracidobacterium sp.]